MPNDIMRRIANKSIKHTRNYNHLGSQCLNNFVHLSSSVRRNNMRFTHLYLLLTHSPCHLVPQF